MISPIYNNGIITQTQNVNHVQGNQENRNDINYQQSQSSVEQHTEDNHTIVIASQNSDQTDTHHDARDEGRNKYVNLRNIKKKKAEEEDGVVIKKSSSGFDMTI